MRRGEDGGMKRAGGGGARDGSAAAASHLERGRLDAARIGHITDAAADGERHEALLTRRHQHLQHRQVGERAVAEAGDVEERHLVGALVIVPLRQLHRLAQIAHLAAGARAVALRLAHVVLVALRHDEVARVVRAHVEARDHAAAEARRRQRGARRHRRRRRRAQRRRGGGGAAEEVAEDLQPDGARLLGVELDGGDAAALDGRDVPLAVVGEAERPVVELGGVGDAERVDEIDGVRRLHAGEQRRRLARRDAVPADLRHRERLAHAEAAHRRRDDPEPRDARALLAALEERLQPEADAEEGPVGAHVRAQRVGVPLLRERGHARAERADAREDEHARVRDLSRRRDVDHLEAERRERVAQRAHVARAVVEQRDPHGRQPRPWTVLALGSTLAEQGEVGAATY